MDNDYYLFKGYSDGSGCPRGIVIKYYSEEKAKRLRSVGYVLEKIKGESI